jgi:hypothetical protein
MFHGGSVMVVPAAVHQNAYRKVRGAALHVPDALVRIVPRLIEQ